MNNRHRLRLVLELRFPHLVLESRICKSRLMLESGFYTSSLEIAATTILNRRLQDWNRLLRQLDVHLGQRTLGPRVAPQSECHEVVRSKVLTSRVQDGLVSSKFNSDTVDGMKCVRSEECGGNYVSGPSHRHFPLVCVPQSLCLSRKAGGSARLGKLQQKNSSRKSTA